jgi:hypothetical protein
VSTAPRSQRLALRKPRSSPHTSSTREPANEPQEPHEPQGQAGASEGNPNWEADTHPNQADARRAEPPSDATAHREARAHPPRAGFDAKGERGRVGTAAKPGHPARGNSALLQPGR